MYKFFDTDDTGFMEYDISGATYRNFLDECFQYCSTISFYLWNENVSIPKDLDKYRIENLPQTKIVYSHYNSSLQDHSGKIYSYKLSPELYNFLTSRVESLFQWICGWGYNNPDDPAFYRADGTVFFSSIIHEGECSLFPRREEDVTKILEQKGWVDYN